MLTKFRTTHLGDLAADEWGTPDGRPSLVLLHGLTFDRFMWHSCVVALQEIDPGRHVLAVDLPGHGETPAPASPHLGDLGRALACGFDTRALAAPVLVGHSASAVDATLYAADHAVRGVVNVDTALQVEGFATMLGQLAERYERDFVGMWRDVLLPSLRVAQLSETDQQLLAEHSTPTQQVLSAGWTDLLDRSPAALAQEVETGLAQVRRSSTPYVTVFGDEPPADYSGWLTARLPQARVEVWPNHTHFPHVADPVRFARLLAATSDW